MTALFQYLLRLGDDNLILGHRLCEMSSRGPFLEEDIAMSNMALDHIGQAEALLQYAGQVENQGRTADNLAYLRPEWSFFNCLLVEQPNRDFAWVMARQFFFDQYQQLLYQALSNGSDELLAGMAARFLKETKYHCRHSSAWMLRLGQGTEESLSRLQAAVDGLWPSTLELFESDAVEQSLKEKGIAPLSTELKSDWMEKVTPILAEAGLRLPASDYLNTGGRRGMHTEYMGRLLSEMQYLQRAFPGAKW